MTQKKPHLCGFRGFYIDDNCRKPAGAALVLACLTAEGFSTVDDIKYIERGYEDFDVKLQNLGAHIEKVTSDHDLQKFKLKVG